MMPILIRRTQFGRRAERIDNDALQSLLAAGCARKVQQGCGMFEEIDPPAVAAVAESTQLYQTKVLVSEEPKSRSRTAKGKA